MPGLKLLGLWSLAALLLPCRAGRVTASGSAQDHYEVLDVARDASQAEVKKKYKDLAKKYHPDKNPAEDAQKKFIEIQRAHETLSCPVKRSKYDSGVGFWSNTGNEDQGEHEQEGPPDGGRGKILEDADAVNAALQGDELWLLHVYNDQQELFGDWMTHLPEDIQLGHVNVERSQELLDSIRKMNNGGITAMPLLVLCQRGRQHSFVPSFSSIFFGLDSYVLREMLGFVDYWSDVTSLRSDEALRSFTALRPGVTSRLRIVFIVEHAEERRFSTYDAATRLRNHACVAQLGYYDATDQQGRPGSFMRGLRIDRIPAVLFYDTLTGSFETVSSRNSLEHAADLADSLIDGAPDPANSFSTFPVQELDVEAYKRRCGEGGDQCDWVVVLATADVASRAELRELGRTFTEACKQLTAEKDRLHQSFACFWLRVGRSPAWAALLQQQLKKTAEGGDLSSPRVFILGAPGSSEGARIDIAPADTIEESKRTYRWCMDAMMHHQEPMYGTFGMVPWPSLPAALDPRGASQEDTQLLTPLGEVLSTLKFEVSVWVQRAQNADPEAISIVVGCFLGVLALLFAAWSLYAARRETTVEEALQKAELWSVVRLCREDVDNSKWGFGLAAHSVERIQIQRVAEGGILHTWNLKQDTRPERKVWPSDQISAVRRGDTTTSEFNAMTKALAWPWHGHRSERHLAPNVTLTFVLLSNDERKLRRIVGTVFLDKMALADCGKFRRREDGRSEDIEIVFVSPVLIAQNKQLSKQGASCMTRMEVGDRILAVNGHTNVAQHLDKVSPSLLLVRWRLDSAVSVEKFDVQLERADTEAPWGFQLKVCVCDLLVANISPSGAMFQWNEENASDDSAGRVVIAGDCLVKANGEESMVGIKRQLRGLKVNLTFERVHDGPHLDEDYIGRSQSLPPGAHNAVPAEAEAEPEPEDDSWEDLDLSVADSKAVAEPEVLPSVIVRNRRRVSALERLSPPSSVSTPCLLPHLPEQSLVSIAEQPRSQSTGDLCRAALLQQSGEVYENDDGSDLDMDDDEQPTQSRTDSHLWEAKTVSLKNFVKTTATDTPEAEQRLVRKPGRKPSWPCLSGSLPKTAAEAKFSLEANSSESEDELQFVFSKSLPARFSKAPLKSCLKTPDTSDAGSPRALGTRGRKLSFAAEEGGNSGLGPQFFPMSPEGSPKNAVHFTPAPPAARPTLPTPASVDEVGGSSEFFPMSPTNSEKHAADCTPAQPVARPTVPTPASVDEAASAQTMSSFKESALRPQLPQTANLPSKALRLSPPDVEGAWLETSGLVALASGESEAHLVSLAQLKDTLSQGGFEVAFFHEARIPSGGLLLIFPRWGLCRWLPSRDLSIGADEAQKETTEIFWKVLAGDMLSLPDPFDPKKLDACLKRCRSSQENSEVQKMKLLHGDSGLRFS